MVLAREGPTQSPRKKHDQEREPLRRGNRYHSSEIKEERRDQSMRDAKDRLAEWRIAIIRVETWITMQNPSSVSS